MEKVSIVIPAYNKADLTVKTVESVLKQTYDNIEIIVVDDGSTDNTRELLIPYAERIRYVYKRNGGACSARNMGIKLATGKYIGFLDCDDLYFPEKVALSAAYLQDNPDFGLVHTAAYFIDEKDTVLREFSHYNSRRIGWIQEQLLKRNFICNSTIVMRKLCFEKVGFFDETIFMPADWDMWLRISEQYKVGFIDRPLTLYRVEGSYILKHIEQSKKEELVVLGKAFKRRQKLKLKLKNNFISNVHRRCAVSYLLIGDFEKAKKELLLSISRNYFNIAAILLLIYFIFARKSLHLLVRRKVFYNFS